MPRRPHLDRWYVEPMKALAVPAIPEGSWRLEMKFDGYRAIATIAGGRAELWSRNHHPLGNRYPELLPAFTALPVKQAVLDGEIVALDPRGRPSFQLLQRSVRARLRPPLFFYAFDLLRLEEKSFLVEPLETRQRALRRLLRRSPAPLRLSEVFDVPPVRLLAEASAHGWEGIIAKRSGSRYEPGARSGAWVKRKIRPEQEFVIGGFTPPRAGRAAFGALLLGYHTSDGLVYAGKVGTGFTQAELNALHRRLQREERARCPFLHPPPERNATWVRPVLVCQVSFAEWTEDGMLRQAAYLGLRDDKPATEVVRENDGSSDR